MFLWLGRWRKLNSMDFHMCFVMHTDNCVLLPNMGFANSLTKLAIISHFKSNWDKNQSSPKKKNVFLRTINGPRRRLYRNSLHNSDTEMAKPVYLWMCLTSSAGAPIMHVINTIFDFHWRFSIILQLFQMLHHFKLYWYKSGRPNLRNWRQVLFVGRHW